MSFPRFYYPGESENDRAYSGGLTPIIVRSSRMESRVGYAGEDGVGPAFGALVFDSLKSRWQLSWSVLSHAEAADLVRQWEDAGHGARPFEWTPDDRTDAMTVVMLDRPQITYQSTTAASATLVLEEQR